MQCYYQISNFGLGLTTKMISQRRILASPTLIKSLRRKKSLGGGGGAVGWKWNSKFSNRTNLDRVCSLLTWSSGKKNVQFFGMWRNLGSSGFRVSEEVRVGVAGGQPVVAMESAIISHGMPHPHNIQTAFHLQAIVRQQGAIPATIGMINGELTVGLSDKEIEILGSKDNPSGRPSIKVSRRDLPIALSQKLYGGTTVSGTIIGAVKAGIPIFATGGIGGVHRGAETSFDISADLRELGRNQITVVSAGVKSILDIGKTLEYLETEGVCVAVLKEEGENEMGGGDPDTKSEKIKFPSFFTRESQFAAPYFLADELQAAHLVNSSINFKLDSGILIGVPIPKEHEEGGQRIEVALKTALEKAGELDIRGKDMTPFLLAEINRLTSGSSLAANKCLVENNVRVATNIAIFLSELRRTGGVTPWGRGTITGGPSKSKRQTLPQGGATNTSNDNEKMAFVSQGKQDYKRFMNSEMGNIQSGKDADTRINSKRPVVIGGSSIDLIMAVQEKEILSDGRTHETRIKTCAGGVARNMAEALQKLGHDPLLISCIGDDLFGRELLRHFKQIQMDTSKILSVRFTSTAIYSALLNHQGECVFGLGDMTINDEMDAQVIYDKCRKVIRDAGIVILDGNLSVDVMTKVMSLCVEGNVPVWFEPTEVRKAAKILKVPREVLPALRYFSPNLRELMSITKIDPSHDLSNGTLSSSPGTNNTFNFDLSQLKPMYEECFSLFVGLELILFTRGQAGVQVISRKRIDSGDSNVGTIITQPAPDLSESRILSVSGAGDCFNAGFISGILQGLTWTECAIKGTFCAKKSLQSVHNVPEHF